MAIIYKISNDINNLIYVGVTKKTLNCRWKQHLRDSRRIKSKYRPLYIDINQYGKRHFKIERIAECNDADAFEQEKYYIGLYDSFYNGYNNTFGGKGKSYCNKELIYILYLCDLIPKEISNITHYDKSEISKILYNNFNIPRGTLAKMSRAQASIAIDMYSLDDVFIQTFNSLTLASQFVGVKKTSKLIPDVCYGKRNDAYGYKWRFH